MSDYLPDTYTTFAAAHPEIAKAHEALGRACHDAGPLDEKTRRLVKLGIASAIESEGGVKTQSRRALAAGATPEELRHVVLLSLTTCGFPGTVAALGWVGEVLSARGDTR